MGAVGEPTRGREGEGREGSRVEERRDGSRVEDRNGGGGGGGVRERDAGTFCCDLASRGRVADDVASALLESSEMMPGALLSGNWDLERLVLQEVSDVLERNVLEMAERASSN